MNTPKILAAAAAAAALVMPASPALASGGPGGGSAGTQISFTVNPAAVTITGLGRDDLVITVTWDGDTETISAA